MMEMQLYKIVSRRLLVKSDKSPPFLFHKIKLSFVADCLGGTLKIDLASLNKENANSLYFIIALLLVLVALFVWLAYTLADRMEQERRLLAHLIRVKHVGCKYKSKRSFLF